MKEYILFLVFAAGAILLLAVALSRERRRFTAVILQKIEAAGTTIGVAYPYDPFVPCWMLVVRDPESDELLEVEAHPMLWAHAAVGRAVVVTCDWLRCRARQIVDNDPIARTAA